MGVVPLTDRVKEWNTKGTPFAYAFICILRVYVVGGSLNIITCCLWYRFTHSLTLHLPVVVYILFCSLFSGTRDFSRIAPTVY